MTRTRLPKDMRANTGTGKHLSARRKGRRLSQVARAHLAQHEPAQVSLPSHDWRPPEHEEIDHD